MITYRNTGIPELYVIDDENKHGMFFNFDSNLIIKTDEQVFDYEYFKSDYFLFGWLTYERWVEAFRNRITYIGTKTSFVHLYKYKVHNLLGPADPINKPIFINNEKHFEDIFGHPDIDFIFYFVLYFITITTSIFSFATIFF